MEFEEKERQKKQNRHSGGGRGRGGGRGGRGRGCYPGFDVGEFRAGNRGRMSDQRFSPMGNMGMQVKTWQVNDFKGLIYLAAHSIASPRTVLLLCKEAKGFTE